MKNGKIAGSFHRRADMRHSSILIPMIDKVLKKSRLSLSQLDGLCISIGPGSFTGLRISVATVKGLAYAVNKGIAAVPTLDVIAENAKFFKGMICPVLDARKNKVYACLYKSDGKTVKRMSEYLLLKAADLEKKIERYKNVVLLGDGVKLIKGGAKEAITNWYPRPDILIKLGEKRFKKGELTKSGDLEPLYLYSKECDITGW